MPRKAKDEKVIEEKKNTKKVTAKRVSKKDNASSAKKKVASKTTTAKAKATTKKADTSLAKKKVASKTTTAKAKATTKKVSSKKVDTSLAKKKVASKVSTSKKKTTTKKNVSKVSPKVSKRKISVKNKKPEIVEYYDLPYKYNKTVVKLLAQTPTTLFVYWEISDKDKENFINTYGEYFFNNTKPVLIIHNHTYNYSFEIDINDFANCWYIHVKDANSDYEIELGRRGINKYIDIPNNYLFISNSNQIESPNDHILFEKLPNRVLFKNIKTNETIEKAFIYYLTKIKSTYNVKDFYKSMYKDEDFDFDKLTLKNPSSSSPSY